MSIDLYDIIEQLNANKHTHKYIFGVNYIRYNTIDLIFAKPLKFKQNDLISYYRLKELDSMLANDETSIDHFAFYHTNDNCYYASVHRPLLNSNATMHEHISFNESIDDMLAALDAIYEYYANNPIITIIDYICYMAKHDSYYAAWLKSNFIKQAMANAAKDYEELKLIIQASSI